MTIKELYEAAEKNQFENTDLFIDLNNEYLFPLWLNDIDFVTRISEGNHDAQLMAKIKVSGLDDIKRNAVISWIDANRG